MRSKFVTWPESAWHIMQFTVCANYLFLPQILYGLAGRSSWLIVIAALLPAATGIWSVYVLYSRFPDQRMGEYLPKIVGRPIAIAIGLFLAVYWYGGAFIDVVVFALYQLSTLMQGAPIVVLLFLNVSLMILVGLLGVKTLVRVVDLLVYMVLPFLLAIVVWPPFSGRLEVTRLLPIRASDFRTNMLQVGLGAIGMYHGYHALFLTGPALNSGRRGAALAMIVGTLLSGVIFVFFMSYPLTTFGWPAVTDFTFPVGSFLEVMVPPSSSFPVRRLDFLIIVFLRFMMVSAAITYFYLSTQTLTDILWPGRYRRPPALITLIAGASMLFLASYITDISMLLPLIKIWIPVGAFATVIIGFLAIVAAWRGVTQGAGGSTATGAGTGSRRGGSRG